MNLENFVLGFFDFVGGIDFNIFGTLLFILLIIFWLVLIGWVWIDSGERTSNMSIRIIYLLLVVFLNIPGLIIYLIIRPSETIEQIYWADLERRYLKYETSELGDCSKCGTQLLPGYVYCSNCGNEIKRKCPNCGVMISKNTKFCAYCGTQVAARSTQEEYPTIEIMEQQILATKEEATETVESKRLKYKQSGGFVVKLGGMIISSSRKLFNIVRERLEKVKKERTSEKQQEILVSNTKKKKKKKRKKK